MTQNLESQKMFRTEYQAGYQKVPSTKPVPSRFQVPSRLPKSQILPVFLQNSWKSITCETSHRKTYFI